MDQPTVSVIIATLNARKVLTPCLDSIASQVYPSGKIEIILGDGGSTDGTIELAKKYGAVVVDNPLKTAEAGKAVAIKKAKGQLLALIDSDNILPDENWLVKMTTPFNNKDVLLSEPWEYTYRQTDPWLTRYFALLGMNDPICLFIGNYDRRGILHTGWQKLGFEEKDRGEWTEVKLNKVSIPTIGANGTLIRRSEVEKLDFGSYYFDIDIPVRLVKKYGEIKVAKVKIGIIHTFVEDSPRKFFRKQWRRISDYGYHQKHGSREIKWTEENNSKGIMKFVISCVLVLPVFWQTMKGLTKSRDWCFIFHPIACYGTLGIYAWGTLKKLLGAKEADRSNWKQ